MTGSGGRTWVARLVDDRRYPRTLFAAAVVFFLSFGLVRDYLYVLNAFDLGIFDQAVRHYAHLQAPIVTIKGDGYNIWADHFHPIIALWAPLYWLWDDVRVLLVRQALVMASAAWPLWRFVRRHWTETATAWPKAFTALVLCAWPIQALAAFDVHEIAFAVPLLAFALDALDRRAVRDLALGCALLLLVREDMGALVAVIGLVWLVWRGPARRTRRDWVVGGALIATGLAAFVLITGVVIPHFAADGYQYWDYPDLGDTPGAALTTILTRPWRVLVLLFWPLVKTGTWLALLGGLAFLPLRSPYALVALPIMAERMLAARENLWHILGHYDAPVWIILALAAVDGFGRLPERWRTRLAPWRGTALIVAGAVSVALAALLFAWTPTSLAERPARAAIVAWLPADTCVAADNWLAAAFTHTNRVTVPGASEVRQDFYIVDLRQPDRTITSGFWTAQQGYDHALGLGFHEAYRAGALVILQAPDYAGPDPARCGPNAP